MMYSYPYFRSPFYNRYSRYGYHYPSNPYSYTVRTPNTQNDSNKNAMKNNHNNRKQTNQVSSYFSEEKGTNKEIKKEEDKSSFDFDSPLFQILGIELYFDDILILCLIFFLYQEGVKDQSLFISLILLLLS